jgi:hypothetical protein
METKKYQKTITIIVLLQGISILCVEKKERVLKKNHDDGGAKYRLHTGTSQHDSLMQNQIRYNPKKNKE